MFKFLVRRANFYESVTFFLERNKDYCESWCNNSYCTPEGRYSSRNLTLLEFASFTPSYGRQVIRSDQPQYLGLATIALIVQHVAGFEPTVAEFVRVPPRVIAVVFQFGHTNITILWSSFETSRPLAQVLIAFLETKSGIPCDVDTVH
jgi:hypothetical protein